LFVVVLSVLTLTLVMSVAMPLVVLLAILFSPGTKKTARARGQRRLPCLAVGQAALWRG
jgi:hypothetical protein